MNKSSITDGSCHCGNIKFRYEVNKPLEKLSIRACTCSFCTKHGAIYTSDPEGKLNVKIKSKENVKKYQFASKQADFIFCSICGVMPFSVTEIGGRTFALINIRTSNIELLELPVQVMDFNNESIEESIKRGKSRWIPIVEGI